MGILLPLLPHFHVGGCNGEGDYRACRSVGRGPDSRGVPVRVCWPSFYTGVGGFSTGVTFFTRGFMSLRHFLEGGGRGRWGLSEGGKVDGWVQSADDKGWVMSMLTQRRTFRLWTE